VRARTEQPESAGGPAGAGTPMIAQYRALKAEHPECLLFFRLGDFYELFFEDAVAAAPALDIALTKRGRQGDQDIPMCGVPVHSAESYLERLIKKGFKVAICEQTEDPALARKRGAKSIVRRDVIRVVTPGTLTEDSLLEARRHNFLAALGRSQQALALAWLDISTGEFLTGPVADGTLAAELARIEPGELLLPEGLLEAEPLRALWRDFRDRLTSLPDREFDSLAGERRLKASFGVASLDGFGAFSRAELGASGALIGYVELTQKGRMPHLAPPRRVAPGTHLLIDAATRRNLELLTSLSGERQGSLLAAVDRTVTGAGGRLLAARLAAPLARAEPIRRRLDAVQALVEDGSLRADLRALLKGCPDLERALSRLSLGRGGPRDLVAIRTGLATAGAIKQRLANSGSPLDRSAQAIADHGQLLATLGAALIEDPPFLARDGGFIAAGWQAELDRLRGLRDQARRHIAELEARTQRETGIGSLKIRHNNLLGYYIEVTATHRAKVPATFVQRQSMAGATRYSTEELAGLESQIASAAERALTLELELFDELCQAILADAERVAGSAQTIARLDVAAGLAEVAVEQRYCRPEMEDGDAFSIRTGRHPVVEQALAQEAKPFIANDAELSGGERLWLLTGPNMAGKSTFLRQNALIAVLAQAGSFVPAERARIGVVDRLFSRVGAADDLARGRSTFMVEMVETAAILNQATEKSLVILDEIGRGTATFDGLSIAWAVVEHLHEVNRCRGLFATHYHELTALAAKLERLVCRTMRVKEWRGEVVFLHEVADGAADRSYGIHVAKLAGLPATVLARAEEVLHHLEQGEAKAGPARLAEDLPLFAAAARPKASSPSSMPPEPSPLENAMREIHPDELTPRDALELIYRLKAILTGEA
jgi:DNA mismatch repair protein MutS